MSRSGGPLGPGPQAASAAPQAALHQENDPLRDGWARYVAFTSDVGEAVKPFIARRLYLGSYAVVAAYGLLDIADKGRRAHHQASAPRHCSPASLPAIAAASLSAGSPTSAAASLALAPDLPLASLPTSASALFQQTAAGVAAACAACLPPPATYVTAAASSISEQPSSAVPVAAAVLDTALWHGAASLALPCLLINRTVWATRLLLSTAAFKALPPRALVLAPSAVGLAIIPLAVPHIDEAVTEWMDRLRPHRPAQGISAVHSS